MEPSLTAADGSAASLNASAWEKRFWWLLAGVVLFRIAYLVFFVEEFDLAADEAYYWDWGRRPAWGYFSKPPLIGWLMGIVGTLTGNSEWGIRAAALVFGTATLVVVQRLARMLFDARAAFVAVVLALLTPANAASNLFFTIDSPLLLAWSLALWLFWRAIQSPQSMGRWLALALAIGFGCLGKQMMLVFPVMMILFTSVSRNDRRLWKRSGFWGAVCSGVVFLIPVLIWQQRHQWITMEHMSHHFDAEETSLAGRVGRFIQFPLFQALLYSVAAWIVMIAALIRGTMSWKVAPREVRFLLVFSAPAFVVVALLALRQEINPNWPAAFHIAAFVLAAGVLSGSSNGVAPSPRSARWWQACLVIGAVFVAAAYLGPVVIRGGGLVGHGRIDAFFRLRGWGEAGQQAGRFLGSVPRPGQTLVLVLGHREYASEMAFHMPQQPTVYRWEPDGSTRSQYEIWGPPTDHLGWDVMVIYPDSEERQYEKKPLASAIRRAFESTEKLGDIEVAIGHGRKRSFQVFLCRSMLGWPEPMKAND